MTMQPGANIYTQGFGSRPENVEVPHYDVRAPTGSDINFPLGKRWVDYVSMVGYELDGIVTAGGLTTAFWNLLGTNTGPLNTLSDGSIVVTPTAGNIVIAGTSSEITSAGTNGPGTITLSLPAAVITPGSLTTTTTLHVGTNETVAGTLGVTGTTTLAAVSVTNATVSGTLGVTGTSTLHAITATGTININASGAGNTVIGTGGTGTTHIGNATGNTNVTGSLSTTTSLSATTTVTGGTGVTATTGNVVATAGQVNAGTTMTAGTGITATTGNIVATAGQVNAGTTMTAGTGITATTGNIVATAGQVNAGTTMTAGTGITATTGNIVASAGNISTTTGSITSATTLTATLGDITATNGNLALATTGNKLVIHATTAASDSIGTGTLSAGGTVVISTTAVTANSLIFLSYVNCTSTLAAALDYGTIMPGTSFVVTSQDATDSTSTFNYWIVN